MGRRHRRGRALHGLLLLDKPAGGSSNHALQRVKRLFDAQKAGHTGSLDPLATGMLPICFGEATKLSAFLLDADKAYETTLRFGQITDSADADGQLIEERAVPADLGVAQLQAICDRFTGPQLQIPPMVSAIKIDGKRLYALAREGKTVERSARAVMLHQVQVLEANGFVARLAVRCSKGTYIRSLVSEIGEALGCGAHVTALRRTSVSPFENHAMVTLDELEAVGDPVARDAHLLPLDAGLGHLAAVVVDEAGSQTFCRGQPAVVSAERSPSAIPAIGPVEGPAHDLLHGSAERSGFNPDVEPAVGQAEGLIGRESSRPDCVRVYDAADNLLGLGKPLAASTTKPLRVQPRRVLNTH